MSEGGKRGERGGEVPSSFSWSRHSEGKDAVGQLVVRGGKWTKWKSQTEGDDAKKPSRAEAGPGRRIGGTVGRAGKPSVGKKREISTGDASKQAMKGVKTRFTHPHTTVGRSCTKRRIEYKDILTMEAAENR